VAQIVKVGWNAIVLSFWASKIVLDRFMALIITNFCRFVVSYGKLTHYGAF